MWDSCELSSILTSANWTMFQNGTPEPPAAAGSYYERLPPLASSHISSVHDAPDTDKWYHKPPQEWSNSNIMEWISHHVEESQFDANLLDLASCSLDGPTLCQLSRDNLLSTFGSLGERLFQSLLEVKAQHGEGDLNMTCDFFDSLFEGYPEILNVSEGASSYELLTSGERSELSSLTQHACETGDRTPSIDNGYESGCPSPGSLENSSTGELDSRSTDSPSSTGSDLEPDLSGEPFPHRTDLKRHRGRPKKQSSGSEPFRSKKSKYVPRGTHLWEFIRDILIHPEQNKGLLKWEDRREGVFRFVKSEDVARLWGMKKRNTKMNYEKLSRAMRYYYKRQILERVDGRRLVYKFGKQSRGWREEEVGLRVRGDEV